MINRKELAREIRKQTLRIEKGKQSDYKFLGFVENQDLGNDIEKFFKHITHIGTTYYNWVSGSKCLQYMLKKVTIKTTIKEIEEILKKS